jgi:hypothetical protein
MVGNLTEEVESWKLSRAACFTIVKMSRRLISGFSQRQAPEPVVFAKMARAKSASAVSRLPQV